MHCVSSYPCAVSSSNMPRINWLKLLHNKVGLSDHTQSILTPALAVAMGASVIEKHFTNVTSREGPDHKFSMNPKTWSEMINFSRELELSLGSEKKIIEKNETESVLVQRRSIHTNLKIKKNTIIKKGAVPIILYPNDVDIEE